MLVLSSFRLERLELEEAIDTESMQGVEVVLPSLLGREEVGLGGGLLASLFVEEDGVLRCAFCELLGKRRNHPRGVEGGGGGGGGGELRSVADFAKSCSKSGSQMSAERWDGRTARTASCVSLSTVTAYYTLARSAAVAGYFWTLASSDSTQPQWPA